MRRITIVCDAAAVAVDVERQLGNLGYRVTGTVASVDAAVASAACRETDLLLLDQALAGASGDLVAYDALRQRIAAPVILMIAAVDEAFVRSAAVTPPFDYIVLPAAPLELRLTVELALCRNAKAHVAEATEDRFFAQSIDMLCFLDFSGHFKRLNPAWERTLGFTREELMSRPFIEFVHPDDRERTLAQNANVRAGGQARSFENRYLCKDGSYRWFHWSAAPDESASVIYSVARDITAQKQAEHERDELVRELQAALAEVSALREILPICSYCRKVRDDEDYWHTVESYIAHHAGTRFSHGICPSCMESEVDPQLDAMERASGP
ncbi:MAG: PAS domain S-box protein [Gemmatimonadota bacterium]